MIHKCAHTTKERNKYDGLGDLKKETPILYWRFFFLFGSWGVFPLAAWPSPSYFPNNKKNHNRLDDQVEFVYAAKANANCGRENVLVDIFWTFKIKFENKILIFEILNMLNSKQVRWRNCMWRSIFSKKYAFDKETCILYWRFFVFLAPGASFHQSMALPSYFLNNKKKS